MKRRYVFGNSLWLFKNHHLSFGTIRKTLSEAMKGARDKHIDNSIGYGVVVSEKLVNGYWETAKVYKLKI
jgi:hypothetical protein